MAASPAVWPRPDPQWIEDRFWIWVHYVAVKIGRGELFEAADGYAFLRGVVLGPLLAVERGVRPQGVRRIEQVAPDAMPALERTVARLDAASCVAALREAIASTASCATPGRGSSAASRPSRRASPSSARSRRASPRTGPA